MESLRTSLASRTHFEVLGLEGQVLGLGLEVSSPPKLPCPQLKNSTTVFFEQLKFRWKMPETSRKLCVHFFCFLLLEHRRSQEGGQPPHPPIEISPMTKCNKKVYCFFSFSFFLAFFAYNSNYNNNITNHGPPSIQFLPAYLTYNLEEMESFCPKSCYLRPTSSLFMNVIH